MKTRAATRPRPTYGRTDRSVRDRVMLLVGTGLIATVLATGFMSWWTLRDLSTELSTQRQAIATSMAAQLDVRLEDLLAQLYGVGLSARDALSGPPATFPLESLRATYLSRGDFDALVVADKDGRVVGAIPDGMSPRTSEASPELLSTLTSDPRPVVRVSHATAGDAAGVVWAAVPIQDWTGRFAGFAAGMIEVSGRRFHRLAGPTLDGSVGVLELLDRDGVTIARSGRPGHAAAASVGDHVAEARLATTGWSVRLHSTGRDPGPALLLRWAGVSAALAAVALVFAWGAGQSVRRPLAVLTAAAERIAGGDLSQAVPVTSADEVGRLGLAFERMRQALRDSLDRIAADNAVLERRVADRTAELARLNAELHVREQTRLQLLRKVIRAQEDERKRLARELHDETSQTLAALRVRLDLAQAAAAGHPAEASVNEARALAKRTLEELHRLMHDLRPSVLDDLGLVAALRWFAEHHLSRRGIGVRFEVGDVPERLAPELETALFRASQEALTNVERHARAERVLVQIGREHGRLVVEIEDDGEGFEPAAVTPRPGDARGLGLLGIRERVELFDGTVTIDSAPGGGTRVVIAVPVTDSASDQHVQDQGPHR